MIQVGSNQTRFSHKQRHAGLARASQGRSSPREAVPCAINTRRTLLCAPVILGGVLLQEAPAAAFTMELPWLGFLLTQPEPVRVPRKQLNLNFAVLLMRSTYDAVDALDFIAMDKFQVKFWKTRQAEFEPYKFMMEPVSVPIGDLSSPVYFDFIAFSLYAAISNAIPDAPQVFEEFCEECDGDPLDKPLRIVRRDPMLRDNKLLPQRLQLHVGRSIYHNLRDGFRGEDFNCPPPVSASAPIEELAGGVSKILETFVKNGYATSASLSDVAGDGSGRWKWKVRVDGGASLWGLQALHARRTLVADAFDAYAVLGFLDASGYEGSFQLEVNDSFAEQVWSVSPRALPA